MCGDNNINENLKCPKCNNDMILKESNYLCTNSTCGFYAPRIIRRKVITKRDLSYLFINKETDFIKGFYKKGLNETFSAYLKLNDDWKISIHLNKESKFNCPLCNEMLYRFHAGYECINNDCKLTRIWDKFRDKEIPKDQIVKLIRNKKTDLIKGFISNKTGKYYNGFIVITDAGKIDIEFEETERTHSYY